MDPKFLGLPDNGVQRFQIHIQLIAVLRRPAAGAVEIAGTGGIHQDRPGDIAVILLHGFLSPGRPKEVRVDDKVLK